MLKTLEIRRYRGIDALDLDDLKQINLLVGANGAGKTTVLESLILLVSAGPPELIPRLAANRGLDVDLDVPRSARDLYWAPMFFNLNIEAPARFAGIEGSGRRLDVEMRIERTSVREVQLKKGQSDPFLLSAEDEQLALRFSSNGVENERRMILGQNAIRIDGPAAKAGIPAAYISSHSGDAADEAKDLARLGRSKRTHLITDALRQVEPRIRSIEVSLAGGQPVIFCDIGLSELVPLSSLGGGILRITRLLLTIASAPGGVALIDELETGLHHSAMSAAWDALRTAAQQFNTQVVATTHSLECVVAAHATLGADGFGLIRIERRDGTTHAACYSAEALAGAVDFKMDVR